VEGSHEREQLASASVSGAGGQPLLELPVAFGYLLLTILLLIAAGAASVIGVAYFGLSLTAAWMVHHDLRRRDLEPLGWTIAVALFGGLAYAPYAVVRDRDASSQKAAELAARARPAAEAAVRRAREATAKARTPATVVPPSSTTSARPVAPPRDPEHPYLQELVAYLWAGETAPPREYATECVAVVTNDLKLPGGMGLGFYVSRLPFGKLYVYPEYLVFLTQSHNRPGEVPPLSRLPSMFLDAWKAIMFWRPIPLARAAWERLTTEERDRLRKPLGNPNSIIVPLAEIRELRVQRHLNMSYLTVVAGDREILLAPNGNAAALMGLALIFLVIPSVRRSIAGIFFLPWEPKLRERLEQAAAANTAAPSTRSEKEP
jgi:hypothetical protein